MGKYSDEKNVQILIALMKEHGIRKVVASPGTTNLTFVASIQGDSFFEIYSAADERSAAYIACGLAEESAEPVALSCTGATASRNYMSGMTEAFYRKIPVLAITSTQHWGRVGHNFAQVIDRSAIPNDIAKISVYVPMIHNDEDEWACSANINKALLELRRSGKGPVHINMETSYSDKYDVETLPEVKGIHRVSSAEEMPQINADSVAIYVGAHSRWTKELEQSVERFCERFNAVVVCDSTSNYKGKYAVNGALITDQDGFYSSCRDMDLLIHLGNVSGAYLRLKPKRVWRVNPDGEVRDVFKKLTYVFEMEEETFFEKYLEKEDRNECRLTYANAFRKEYESLYNKIPELPFSNIWVAQKMVKRLPADSVIHLGILNSLRSWNFFELPERVYGYANTGGFGIDGCVSALVGASLANPNKLYFGVVGDLAFFYDMNVLGNRHFPKNIRLMVINNGCGTEFKNYNHKAARFGDGANAYVAAEGHYGKMSKMLLKQYVEELGCTYMCAENKEDFLRQVERFTTLAGEEASIVMEVFTESERESEALQMMRNL